MWSGVSSVPSAPMLLHCMALLLRVMAFTKVNANSHLELTALKATVTHEVDSGCDASFGYDTRTAITFSSATRAKQSAPVTFCACDLTAPLSKLLQSLRVEVPAQSWRNVLMSHGENPKGRIRANAQIPVYVALPFASADVKLALATKLALQQISI